jgi:cob(I)alamin adenosyltransferase
LRFGGFRLARRPGDAAIVKIYTRKGDAGETSLFSGERVAKDEPRMEALGAVDELVAWLGVARAELADEALNGKVAAIQTELYLLLTELATSGPARMSLPADAAQKLEPSIDALDAALPPLKDFVMPGQSRASAALHVARTVCRRAERRVIAAGRAAPVPAHAVVYLNRLSDLLFVMARAADHGAGGGGGDRTFKSALD